MPGASWRQNVGTVCYGGDHEVDIVITGAEFLNEELEKAGDFEPEAILQILSDEKYKSIRNRAVARGNTVMAVDAAFGGIANVLRALKVATELAIKCFSENWSHSRFQGFGARGSHLPIRNSPEQDPWNRNRSWCLVVYYCLYHQSCPLPM